MILVKAKYKALTDVVVMKKDPYTRGFFVLCRKRRGSIFPLPYGNYKLQGKVKLYSNFNTKIFIPRKEKNNKLHKTKLFIKSNPNKASIDIHNHYIIIDPIIFNAPEPIRKAVLLHELGHYYYYDENKCDKFAIAFMRWLGYPKSVIAAAFNSVLFNDFRRKEVFKFTQNY